MRVLFTLTSSESKRLIAKGVKALPVVKKAMQENTIIIAGGTTNAYVAEELLGVDIPDKTGYTVGIIMDGVVTRSASPNRVNPYIISKGVPLPTDVHWKECLPKMVPGDVFIKGGNALDHSGLAAVMVSDLAGGTIGAAQGILYARGIRLIVPIGLEKLVPSVRDAVEFMAGSPLDQSTGEKVGLIPMLGATVITELTALETMFNVKARCVTSGGVSGSEGSVTIVIEGIDEEVQRAMETINEVKGEAPIKINY
ncbi:MAG: hypothetical protein M0T74_14275 [Desulfitobacterium hafniense]|nr:hypothetical protein [Desulfitobacterium hafniense]